MSSPSDSGSPYPIVQDEPCGSPCGADYRVRLLCGGGFLGFYLGSKECNPEIDDYGVPAFFVQIQDDQGAALADDAIRIFDRSCVCWKEIWSSIENCTFFEFFNSETDCLSDLPCYTACFNTSTDTTVVLRDAVDGQWVVGEHIDIRNPDGGRRGMSVITAVAGTAPDLTLTFSPAVVGTGAGCVQTGDCQPDGGTIESLLVSSIAQVQSEPEMTTEVIEEVFDKPDINLDQERAW